MKELQTSGSRAGRRSLRQGIFLAVALGAVFLLSYACSPVSRDITIVDSASGGQGAGDGDGDSGGTIGLGGQDGTGGLFEPVTCTGDDDCPAEAAFCDPSFDRCRGCVLSDECVSLDDSRPFCEDGACIECLTDSDCSASSPVCDEGSCRPCAENSECTTDACTEAGTCVEEESAVFALAQTGSPDNDCGARDKPCRSLFVASALLSEERPNLIFMPTNEPFTMEELTLPDDIGITIYGNDVQFSHTGETPIVKQGGSLTLIGMYLTGFGPSQVFVTANEASLVLRDSFISSGGTGVLVEGASVHVEGCEFYGLEVAGVSMGCETSGQCNPGALIERSYFRNIPDAVVAGLDNTVIRNNIFDRIARTDFARGVNLMAVAEGPVVAFNTFYRSGNCSNTGVIACNGDGAIAVGNLTVDSTIDHYSGPCYSQVYSAGCNVITYALAETTYAGDTNITGDAMLADAENGDFWPLSGSDALDVVPSGYPNVPEEDYFGNPRPVGGAADIGACERQ